MRASRLRFGAKVPGTQMEIRDVNMDFAYGGSFTESSPEAYERLILDVLLGDPPLFPQHEEVELSWEILDPDPRLLGRSAGATAAVRAGIVGTARSPKRCWPGDGFSLETAVMIITLDGTTSAKISAESRTGPAAVQAALLRAWC